MEGIEKPAARKLLRLLDLGRPMGLPAAKLEENSSKRYYQGKVPLLRYFLETKAKYPTHVLLIRVRRLGEWQ